MGISGTLLSPDLVAAAATKLGERSRAAALVSCGDTLALGFRSVYLAPQTGSQNGNSSSSRTDTTAVAHVCCLLRPIAYQTTERACEAAHKNHANVATCSQFETGRFVNGPDIRYGCDAARSLARLVPARPLQNQRWCGIHAGYYGTNCMMVEVRNKMGGNEESDIAMLI